MSATVEIQIRGLNEIMQDLEQFGDAANEAAETRLGEMWDDFKFYLDGGLVRPPLGPGEGAWAVATGRSVKNWRPRIRGFEFVALNSTPYAQYVPLPKPGLPKDKYPPQPKAVPPARRKFRELAEIAAEDIGDALAEILRGDV